MMMAWTSAVLEVVRPLLRSRWFQVRDREPLVYRRLGVLQYGALLRRVGWERATSSGRSFDGTRSSLPDLERRTRMSEFAHVVLGALGTGMVVVALACHAWDAAAWLFAANVVLHAIRSCFSACCVPASIAYCSRPPGAAWFVGEDGLLRHRLTRRLAKTALSPRAPVYRSYETVYP